MRRLTSHQLVQRPMHGSPISTPLLWMPRSAFVESWATSPSNKRILSKVSSRILGTRPMALDHLLIEVEPSDCGE